RVPSDLPFTGFRTFLNVVQDGDAQDCTAQVVGVASAPAGVEARVHSRRVVDGCVSVGSGRICRGVVPRRQEEIAIIVEGDVGADMTALPALSGDLEDLLFRLEIEVAGFRIELEA